jgi:hypothetical protein
LAAGTTEFSADVIDEGVWVVNDGAQVLANAIVAGDCTVDGDGAGGKMES